MQHPAPEPGVRGWKTFCLTAVQEPISTSSPTTSTTSSPPTPAADIANLMAATQRPVAASALEARASAAAWKAIPSYSLVATDDHNIPPAAQPFMAERAHARTVEVKASHAVTVSQPDAVARIIEQAAQDIVR
ncbi:alpha/beta fold hydrolase [Streptomyces pseudogriseolus]|uniref:alpha/beta fold hydrolase n=1 Tax=Streptomyces pseudogriseolus TaxID=36817 RepID=UPI0034809BDE